MPTKANVFPYELIFLTTLFIIAILAGQFIAGFYGLLAGYLTAVAVFGGAILAIFVKAWWEVRKWESSERI